MSHAAPYRATPHPTKPLRTLLSYDIPYWATPPPLPAPTSANRGWNYYLSPYPTSALPFLCRCKGTEELICVRVHIEKPSISRRVLETNKVYNGVHNIYNTGFHPDPLNKIYEGLLWFAAVWEPTVSIQLSCDFLRIKCCSFVHEKLCTAKKLDRIM